MVSALLLCSTPTKTITFQTITLHRIMLHLPLPLTSQIKCGIQTPNKVSQISLKGHTVTRPWVIWKLEVRIPAELSLHSPFISKIFLQISTKCTICIHPLLCNNSKLPTISNNKPMELAMEPICLEITPLRKLWVKPKTILANRSKIRISWTAGKVAIKTPIWFQWSSPNTLYKKDHTQVLISVILLLIWIIQLTKALTRPLS